MAPHVKSKRQTLRHKYKVARKVRQHNREVRKSKKHKPEVRRLKGKDPGIPNLWPYKQEMLESIERKKAEKAEAKKAAQALRREVLREARAEGVNGEMLNIVVDAKIREREFAAREDAAAGSSEALAGVAESSESSKRAFMKEFKKVVETSDVILEVLDARDPLGCRCYEAERSIMAQSGGAKRIVLVLNKVDMVPKEVTEKWLSYLRNDLPTIAFRASLQEGRGKGQASMSALAASSVNTGECLGATTLLSMLKNYCRSRELKTSIAVGVIGYPNVGKSSLINSLKRSRAVTAGATPGVTRCAQEVHLDKNIRLVDCPGIVFSSQQADALVLRNCIKVENLYDPIAPVETIIKRVGCEPLMVAYGVPAFDKTAEFLACLCSTRGKYRVGGVFDLEGAARIVLKDWNSGNIPFYTLPPKGAKTSHLGASVVGQWGEEFNVNAFTGQEKMELDGIKMAATVRARCAEVEASVGCEGMDRDVDMGGEGAGKDREVKKDANNANEEKSSFHVADKRVGGGSSQKRKG